MTENTKAAKPNAARPTNHTMRLFYALAILFVVAGHSSVDYPAGLNLGYNLFPVYAFHMPMFIFVAGYFYNAKHEGHPLRFVWNKVKRLIIPMYAIHVLMGLFVMLLAAVGFSAYDGATLSWKSALLDPWLHDNMHEFSFDLAMWFLIPLFCSQCTFMLLHKLLVRGDGRRRMLSDALLTVACVACGMWVTARFGDGPANEAVKEDDLLRLWQTGYFLSFVAIGYCYREYIERHLAKVPDAVALISLALIQLALLIIYGDRLTLVVCWLGFPAGPIGSLAMGMTGILFWMRVSRMLSQRTKDSWLANEVGSNTFSIMAFHFVGFFVLNCAFYAVAKLSGGSLLAFSTEAFRQGGIYYKFIPGRLVQIGAADAWDLLYVLFGIGVPLALHRVWVPAWTATKAACRLMTAKVEDRLCDGSEAKGIRDRIADARDRLATHMAVGLER